MRSKWVVLGAALFAVLGRYCGLLWPLRPDESGFLLVARSWAPRAESLYGPYFVDRPPLLIAVVRSSDALLGPLGLRALSALGCGVAVLLAAALVREVARHRNAVRDLAHPVREEEAGRRLDRVQQGVAVLTAAFLVTPLIDAVGTKGELLGVPVLLGGSLLTLRALRALNAGRLRAALGTGFAAGVLATVAVGLKQSLVSCLVFAGALLLHELVRGRQAPRSRVLALGALFGLGAALPVLGTVAWALAAGVDLHTLTYAVISFRGDATEVIATGSNRNNDLRAFALAGHFLLCGMALAALWGMLAARHAVPRLPGPVLAAALALGVDLVVVGVSGSFWTPYLFAVIPTTVLLWVCARVTAALPDGDVLPPVHQWRPRLASALVALAGVSSVALLAGWTATVWWRGSPPTAVVTGEAIAEASGPDETLTVYGGRADLQYASGLDSPYAHLWSLPMRTMDRDLDDLRSLLEGPEAPDWFALAAPLSAWNGIGEQRLADVLVERYRPVAGACPGTRLYRLASAPAVESLDTDCVTPWGQR